MLCAVFSCRHLKAVSYTHLDVYKRQVQAVVFDRNGYLYHGRIKELADAARNGGLKF